MMKKEDVMELIDMTKLTNMINGLKDKEIVVKEKHTINWKKGCLCGWCDRRSGWGCLCDLSLFQEGL